MTAISIGVTQWPPHERGEPPDSRTEIRLIEAGACPSRDEARQPRVLRCGPFEVTAFGT